MPGHSTGFDFQQGRWHLRRRFLWLATDTQAPRWEQAPFWKQALSDDGGVTCEPYWTMDFTRA